MDIKRCVFIIGITLLCGSGAVLANSNLNEKDIINAANHKNIGAIEPRVDRVWHLIPGYNGISVDIKQTMKYNKNKKIITWIMKEVEPLTSLNNFRNEPIYKGNPAKPMVALMINVAWGEQYLPSMLQIFENAGVKASFFLDGQWLRTHRDLAKTILSKGHELSNHAYSHPKMSKLSVARQTEEIAKTNVLLTDLGVSNKWFAPPSGDFDQRTLQIASKLKLHTILWTVDTIDWRENDSNGLLRRVIPKIEPGSMILMHPTAVSVSALPTMIQSIKSKKLQFGTLSDLLSTRRIFVE